MAPTAIREVVRDSDSMATDTVDFITVEDIDEETTSMSGEKELEEEAGGVPWLWIALGTAAVATAALLIWKPWTHLGL